MGRFTTIDKLLWGFIIGMVGTALVYHYDVIPDERQRATMIERHRPIATSTPQCQWAQLDPHNRVLVKGDLCACSNLLEKEDDNNDNSR